MKTLLPAFIPNVFGYTLVSSLLLTAALQAGDKEKSPSTPSNTVAECPAPGPVFSIDYLYWKVQEEQLYPVIVIDQSGIKPKNQKFEYTSGFRAALGYDFYYDNYDMNFAWTRIRPRTTSNFSTSTGSTLIVPSFEDQTSSDVPKADSVTSHWHLNYDMLDLTFGRRCTMGEHFTFHPNIGVKGGWIDQRQRIFSNNVFLGQSPVVEVVQGTVNRVNNFKGIGPRVGIDLRYGLGSCFGLFGTVSGALLYGDFNVKTQTFLSDTLDNNDNPVGPKTVLLNNSDHRLSPTAQILFGLDYSLCFSNNYQIHFGVAYEAQFWWNQLRSNNSIPQALFINNPSGGDLMMQGLTLQARMDF